MPLGRLSKLTDGSGNLIVQYTYDAAGNLIQKDKGNGTRTVYTYDGDGDVLSITNYAPDHVTINSFDDYTYDALGQRAHRHQPGRRVGLHLRRRQPVDRRRSSRPTAPTRTALTAQNLQYVYDAAGNRVSETVNGVITTYVVNNVNEYTSSTTSGVTTTYQYDADGNLIAQTGPSGTTSYTFNELNQLTAVNGPGLSASYGYDPLGNRISQTINGVTTNFEIDPTSAATWSPPSAPAALDGPLHLRLRPGEPGRARREQPATTTSTTSARPSGSRERRQLRQSIRLSAVRTNDRPSRRRWRTRSPSSASSAS